MRFFLYIAFTCFFYSSSFGQANTKTISHYVFPEFKKGSILLNNGQIIETFLNYNSLTKEMIFEENDKRMAFAGSELGTIDTVFISDRKFIPKQGIFVELLYQSKWELFIEYRCDLKEVGKEIGYGARSRTTNVTSYSSFYSTGQLYDLKLPDIFEIRPNNYYWIRKNDEFTRIRSLRDLKRLYKDRKELFKTYSGEHKIKYNNKESIIQLIEYLESN